jgi:hypothetical protein
LDCLGVGGFPCVSCFIATNVLGEVIAEKGTVFL